jgi:hypothetical protein
VAREGRRPGGVRGPGRRRRGGEEVAEPERRCQGHGLAVSSV